jgi:hypothetical protein
MGEQLRVDPGEGARPCLRTRQLFYPCTADPASAQGPGPSSTSSMPIRFSSVRAPPLLLSTRSEVLQQGCRCQRRA